jgi:membrane-associated PAP2 superfamily phosphatase
VAQAGTGKSFVSGHGASGFAVALGWLLLRRRRPWLAAGVMIGGLAWGGAVAVARMAVGGHWASDLWWSGVVVWTVGLALWYGLRTDNAAARREAALPAPASAP